MQELVRNEDSGLLLGFTEKILLSSDEEFQIVENEGTTRCFMDPALMRLVVYKLLGLKELVSLVMLRLSFEAECEGGVFCA